MDANTLEAPVSSAVAEELAMLSILLFPRLLLTSVRLEIAEA